MNNNKLVFKSGNEIAALAACQINYDVMGYYPISPSTEIAQLIDIEKSNGNVDIHLIPADGEHSSAGICYGAALTGARVFNATSANGLSFMLEQLPVFSGTRIPMVMNLVTRTVSAPLNIHCEHTDLYSTLQTGWLTLCASTTQSVYDMNIIALKLAEQIELPALVVYDGYITSHQKHNSYVFNDDTIVKKFLGDKFHPKNKYIDNLENPLTIGAHMLPEHTFNNKVLVDLALKKGLSAFEQITDEYSKLSGRKYDLVEEYLTEDADKILLVLNSTAEIAKDAIDQLRKDGVKVGLIKPNILRPFPTTAILNSIKHTKHVTIMDRADNPGNDFGILASDINNIIQSNNLDITTNSIIFGLGGKEIFIEDIKSILTTTFSCTKSFYGTTTSNTNKEKTVINQHVIYNSSEYKIGGFKSEFDTDNHKLSIKIPPLKNLMKKPKRIASGHSACPGCGIFPGVETFLRGIEGDVVLLNQTGCAYVVTANYPHSAHKGHYIHNLFQNGSSTMSGLVDAILKLKDDNKINFDNDATFVMLSGDGGFDIGMGPAIGTALRNHKLIMLEYDNEGYMNTGAQQSYSTPLGHRTSTSNVGSVIKGRMQNHKDTVQIMAATNMPYVFTGVDAFPQDLVKKAAKAQWYANNVGTVYGKILIACPLNWKSKDNEGSSILETAVNCNFFPLYEIENGITNITYDPSSVGNNVEPETWLNMMYKSKHLLLPENRLLLNEFKDTINLRYNKLKIKHEHPNL